MSGKHFIDAAKFTIDKFRNILKTKDTALSVDYLTILRREANSYFSVPVSFPIWSGFRESDRFLQGLFWIQGLVQLGMF